VGEPAVGISAVTTTGKYRRLIAGAALAVATLASTVPAAAQTPPPDPVIGAAGDIACDPADPNFSGADPATCQHRATAGLLSGATAVLPLGDVQYEEPALAKYENGYGAPGSWGDYNSVVRPAIGNHEYKEPGAAGYFDYFNSRGVVTGARDQAYYSYNVEPWHLVALNSNCRKMTGGCGGTSPQMTWLKKDLAGDTHQCELAYWHHPRFSSRTTGKPMQGAWSKLYAAGVDVVLNGHQHNYERFAPMNVSGAADPIEGIRQFIVGSGGRGLDGYVNTYATSEVRNNTDFGVLKLTLHATSYDWQFVSTQIDPLTGAPRIVDQGSALCH